MTITSFDSTLLSTFHLRHLSLISFCNDFTRENHHIGLTDDNKTSNIALKRGNNPVILTDTKRDMRDCILIDTFHISTFKPSIFSLQAST